MPSLITAPVCCEPSHVDPVEFVMQRMHHQGALPLLELDPGPFKTGQPE
eukprot:gene4225-4527_t